MYKLSSCFAVLAALFSVGASAFQYYEEPDPTPYLANVGAPPACDYIIDDNAKWANINSGSYRVFCVAPGDYSAATIPQITADGTAQSPRWLRYYSPGVADDVHPYHMADSSRAKIKALYLNGANYWVIDRIYTTGAGSTTSYSGFLVSNADNNVFQRNLMKSSANGINFILGSSYNTAQYNVAELDAMSNADGVAYNLMGWSWNGTDAAEPPKYNKIVSNEAIDWNDGFQIVADGAAHNRGDDLNYEGNVFYNNDVWWTGAKYRNCSTGVLDPAGNCSCDENGLEWKAGGTNPNAPIIIAHNRVWGGRPMGTWCAGNIYTHQQSDHLDRADYLQLEGNILFNGGGWGGGLMTGIYTGVISGAGLKIKNNLFYGGWYPTSLSGLDANFLLAAINVNQGGNGMEFSGNTIVGWGPANGKVYSIDLRTTATNFPGSGNSVTNNVIINSPLARDGTLASGWTISGNEYYNSDVPSYDGSPAVNVGSVTGTDWDNQFCTTIKRITNPTVQCFDYALNAAAVPTEITVPTDFRILD